MNPSHTLVFFTIVFDRHINLQFMPRSSELSLHLKIFRLKYYERSHLSSAKLTSHTLLISAPLIWRTVQIAKALSIQFSPFYCYVLLSFDWSYFPRYFVLSAFDLYASLKARVKIQTLTKQQVKFPFDLNAYGTTIQRFLTSSRLSLFRLNEYLTSCCLKHVSQRVIET
jgi:hypothetical protein